MASNKVIRRSDPNSIHNKVIVGYQGWFTCAGDGPPVHNGHHGWLHWFDKPIPDGGHPNFDLFPDVSEYTPEELYPAPALVYESAQGTKPAMLFSSRNPQTVRRHFHWMAEHGIDGAFLQRFATQCEVDGNPKSAQADLMRLRDEVLDRVREAAEAENRVWAIMYDVSGVPADRIEHVLRVDWDHLVRDKRILDSPYYLKERGQPVVALWGFGFVKAHHNPQTVTSIVRHIKSTIPQGVYVWGGVPSQWRTLTGDMDPNEKFLEVFKNEFDALSPWTIGRYHTRAEVDRFCEERTKEDIGELKDREKKVEYIPTIWPGGSSHNLTSGRLGLNDSPREGGKFFWQQLWNVKHLGARTIYVAMFDEYDEGTAILPSIPLKRSLPKSTDPERQFPFIALDADGIDNLTPDWYLRICGFASEAMKDERRVYEELPKKELDDYWATRPKYENVGSAAYSSDSKPSEVDSTGQGSGSSSSAAAATVTASDSSSGASANVRPPVRQSTGAWGVLMDDNDGAAPPPYTLEASSEPVETPINASASSGAPSGQARNSEAEPISSASSNSLLNNTSTRPGAPATHRASSYPAPSTAPPIQDQGATGLGRATSYSPVVIPQSSGIPSVSITAGTPNSARPSFAPPMFAPPSSAPPGSLSSGVGSHSNVGSLSSSPYQSQPQPATQIPHRPPIHPASTLATPGLTGSTNVSRPSTGSGASTPISHQSYSPHQAPGSLPINAHNSSTSNLAQNFSTSMNLGPGSAIGLGSVSGSSNPSSSAPHSPTFSPTPYSTQPSSSPQPHHGPHNAYSNIQGAGGFAPGRPTGTWATPSGPPSQPPFGSTGYFQQNSSNSGYLPATNVSSTGVISNPSWGAPISGTPSRPPHPHPHHASTMPVIHGMPGSSPGPGSHSASPVPSPGGFAAPGFAPPGHAPGSTGALTPPQPATAFSGVSLQPPPAGSSNPSSTPAWTSGFPGKNTTTTSTSTSTNTNTGTDTGTDTGTGSNTNVPALPPRPSTHPGDPGHPGGFVAPQENKYLGNFMGGIVRQYAGENTRKQVEKAAHTAAQAGQQLLGKFTSK